MNHSHYKPVKMLRVEIEPHGVEAAEPSLVQTPKRKESLPSTGALIELSGASQDDFPTVALLFRRVADVPKRFTNNGDD
jgi:hypothetical protein